MLKRLSGALLAATLTFGAAPATRAAEPITIGFGMALTGGLAPNGKAALLAMQIWEEETNAKQSRSRHQRLCHEHDRARTAGDHAA
jgi:branched-chain amino acid transport system substrate-binding protein